MDAWEGGLEVIEHMLGGLSVDICWEAFLSYVE